MIELILFLCQYELLSWIFRIWIFIPQLRRITLKLCQVALHIENYLFYHLPTRWRAGIKLGDAWYVSNVSIIFDCCILLYYPFWMFMGFTLHFYIIFGTNLLTGGPARIAVFLPISVLQRKGISNGVQTGWNLRERSFWNKCKDGDLEWTSSNKRGGPSSVNRPTSSSYIYSGTLKTSEATTKT